MISFPIPEKTYRLKGPVIFHRAETLASTIDLLMLLEFISSNQI
jgi:hypothetical protein